MRASVRVTVASRMTRGVFCAVGILVAEGWAILTSEMREDSQNGTENTVNRRYAGQEALR